MGTIPLWAYGISCNESMLQNDRIASYYLDMYIQLTNGVTEYAAWDRSPRN